MTVLLLNRSLLVLLVVVASPLQLFTRVVYSENRTFTRCSFEIDFESNTFVNGQPFRYISGSFHYFRSLEGYWDEIFNKMRLAGLNTVQTYVEWESHQPNPEEIYNFEGNLNILKYLELAQSNGLLVILRPGPFIDAERNMGGFPPWLLWQKEGGMAFRTKDLEYLYFVSRWFDHLLPLLRPHLYSNGGPIIMMQVENEYGYNCRDPAHDYTEFLRDLLRFHLGPDIVLFTTDGAKFSALTCGTIPQVYPTVDFGPVPEIRNILKNSGFLVFRFDYVGDDKLVNTSFALQRQFAPNGTGPLANSEFYIGSFDFWGKPHSKTEIAPILATLNAMLAARANVNFYMFYGGTSFKFGSGAYINDGVFYPCLTSYDYDAPLSEARDPTLKYFAIKNVIAKYADVPAENPVFSKKLNLGKIPLRATEGQILELLKIFGEPVESLFPLSFEDMKCGSREGFLLYSTKISFRMPDPAILRLPGIKDRAYVYVDEVYLGVLSRTENALEMPIFAKLGQTLSILVENQGRVVGSEMVESKGIGQNVTLSGKTLIGWTMSKLDLDGEALHKMVLNLTLKESSGSLSGSLGGRHGYASSRGIGLFWGNFTVEQNQSSNGLILDTFVRFDGWTKGLIWTNGFNLGRYWPVVGPQETLYLPGQLLYSAPRQNTIVVLELEQSPDGCFSDFSGLDECSVNLTDEHVIDGLTPGPTWSSTSQQDGGSSPNI